MKTHPLKIYDTTLRDGTQGEGISLFGHRQAAHRGAARPIRLRLHRGRLPRLQPARHRVLRRGAEVEAPAMPAWPRSAQPAAPASRRQRTPAPGAARRRHAGRDHRRQNLAPARHRDPAHDGGREPGDDRGLRAPPGGAGTRGRLRRGAFLRRLQGQPRVRPPQPRRGKARRRGQPHRCATPTAARCVEEVRRDRGGAPCRIRRRARRRPLPQRQRARRRRFARRGRRPGPPWCRAR